MKYLIGLLCLFSVAQAQFAPTSAKTKFVNGIGIGSKDTSQFTAADTIALTIARDSVMYYRYKGFWRPIATGGNLSAYKLISDTLFSNGYTTRARLKQAIDSLAGATVSGVSSFNSRTGAVTSQVGDYSAFFKGIGDSLFNSGFTTRGRTKQYGDSIAATKLSISDTSGMLSSYARTSNLPSLTPYKLISDTLFNNGYTTRARLKQGLDSLAATKGTVNSVGLTMPVAFNVANSPITSSGTIAVTAAGNATQYIRGDGALATLPTSGSGGGASVSYYLNGSVNQGIIGGVTYYEMNKTPIVGAGTDFTRNSNGYIASFLTDANDPALLKIPAGNWNFETYFSASSGGGSPTFYLELYKYNGTTFTLIASNSGSPRLISDGTNIEAYFSALAVPETVLTLTDRLAVRIYVNNSGRTITLHTENRHLCQVITTFTTGLTALNGLTEQVQFFSTGTSGTDFNIASSVATHTFNLPTASATNRGALSSSDWTTFNNKIGAGDTAAMLAPYYRTATATAALATKLNISDTAAMLLGYTRVQRFTDSLTNVQSRIQTKQNILTLTTTGTSGAATLVGATLNIPQYQAALTNPVTGTGTTNFLPKFTGSTTVGNSQVFDDGTRVFINATTAPGLGSPKLVIKQSSANTFEGLLVASSTNNNVIAIAHTGTQGIITTNYGSAGANTPLAFGTDGTVQMTLSTSGNLLIGTTTDNGNRLQVSGNQTIGGTLGVTGATTFSSSVTSLGGGIEAQEGFLRTYHANASSGAGYYIESYTNTTGSTKATVGNFGVLQDGASQRSGTFFIDLGNSGAPSRVFTINKSGAITASSSFRASSFGRFGGAGSNAMLEVQSSTGEVFRADAASGAFRIVADQTGVSLGGTLVNLAYNNVINWNSSANQYITADASNLYLGTAGASRLTISTSGAATFGSNMSIGGTLGVTGNLLIGTTTDNGARLQVSGNQTISGTLGVTGATTLSTLTVASGAAATSTTVSNNGDFISNWIGNSTIQLFSIRNVSTTGVFLNTQNSAPLVLGVSTGTSGGSVVNHLSIASSGAITASSLAGTGTRVVEASSAGLLSATKVIDAGTYTPTLTNTFNITSSALVTGSATKYTRVGNMVTVTGRVTITPTSFNFVTLTLTLPVSSTSTDTGVALGSAVNSVTEALWGFVSPSTNSAFINFYNTLLTAYEVYYSFTYQVQ